MPTPKPSYGPVGSGVPSRVRHDDRPARAVKALVAAARRGHEMVTIVESGLDSLGAVQLRAVVTDLFVALAEAYAAQRDPTQD